MITKNRAVHHIVNYPVSYQFLVIYYSVFENRKTPARNPAGAACVRGINRKEVMNHAQKTITMVL
jgi:hypothetical protein